MSDTFEVNSISQAHLSLGLDTPKHPLISVVRADEIKQVSEYEDVSRLKHFEYRGVHLHLIPVRSGISK